MCWLIIFISSRLEDKVQSLIFSTPLLSQIRTWHTVWFCLVSFSSACTTIISSYHEFHEIRIILHCTKSRSDWAKFHCCSLSRATDNLYCPYFWHRSHTIWWLDINGLFALLDCSLPFAFYFNSLLNNCKSFMCNRELISDLGQVHVVGESDSFSTKSILFAASLKDFEIRTWMETEGMEVVQFQYYTAVVA